MFVKILWILLILFLGLLALICVLSFIPIRYFIRAQKEGSELDYEVNLHYLLKIIQLHVYQKKVYILLLYFIRCRLFDFETPREDREEEKQKKGKQRVTFHRLMYRLKTRIYKHTKLISELHKYPHKMELIRILLQLLDEVSAITKPKKKRVDIEIGAGNSALTGKIYAYASAYLAKYDGFYITPNFKEKQFDFHMELNGYITPRTMLFLALKYLKYEPIKSLFKHRKD